MTLSLFADPTESRGGGLSQIINNRWRRLLDDQPIVSGRHPLHEYMGTLGAQSFCERGTLSCYDPSNWIGYPKTPVFDSGSRPAELFLILGGGHYNPQAYKIGLAVCSCLAPVFLALAGWGLGLGRGFTCLVIGLGLLVWWGTPAHNALEDGDLDLLLASLAALAHVCLLVRFDRLPGFFAWFCLLLTGSISCYAHPVIFLMLLPLGLLYYLSVGAKHQMNWHLALLASLAGALAANSFWLPDWVKYWWIRLPLQLGSEPLRHRTLQTIWDAPLWGDATDRNLAAALFMLALLGVCIFNQSHQRAAARLLGLGLVGFFTLAIGGIAMQPLGRLGAAELLLPALWFATPPAVYAFARLGEGFNRLTRSQWSGVAVSAAMLVAALYFQPLFFKSWIGRCEQSQPLALGLGAERSELVELLRVNTGVEGRILWEDRTGKREAPRWSALLPLLTERSYLGGLDPQASIEHAYASFIDHHLAGRSISDWSDAELDEFCIRYNIGWVVCWSPEATSRFRAWKSAQETLAVQDEGQGYLFTLPTRSYVLKGQARWISANRQRIALADVVPEDGIIVLSLHHQAGLQASPGRVVIEREPDPFDPIPFIRLRVPGPVARLTLTWNER